MGQACVMNVGLETEAEPADQEARLRSGRGDLSWSKRPKWSQNQGGGMGVPAEVETVG